MPRVSHATWHIVQRKWINSYFVFKVLISKQLNKKQEHFTFNMSPLKVSGKWRDRGTQVILIRNQSKDEGQKRDHKTNWMTIWYCTRQKQFLHLWVGARQFCSCITKRWLKIFDEAFFFYWKLKLCWNWIFQLEHVYFKKGRGWTNNFNFFFSYFPNT